MVAGVWILPSKIKVQKNEGMAEAKAKALKEANEKTEGDEKALCTCCTYF